MSDTGKGIAQDKQSEIFNSFSQEDTSITRNFGGTGLELAICKHLVKLMGGEIGVISELGKGSEFWFELPVELIQSQDYLNQDLVFQNVMIVDDHPIAREMLAGMVRSLGWSADVAASGEEAIKKIKYKAQENKLTDLLLLDWRMPEMYGIEVGQKIKQILANIPNQPIIFLATAQDRDQLLQEEGVEMASSVLSKPITASVLYNVMTEVKNIQKAEINSGVDSTTDNRLLNLRVLIVDDSELNLDMARRILESEGATIELANDGESALEWLNLNADRIDVVLMDIQMPLMDGYQATYEIRETLGLTSLPVIALTARAFKNQQEAALSAGMNGFIAKPFDVDELIIYLQQYINEPKSLMMVESNLPVEMPETFETPLIDWQRVYVIGKNLKITTNISICSLTLMDWMVKKLVNLLNKVGWMMPEAWHIN